MKDPRGFAAVRGGPGGDDGCGYRPTPPRAPRKRPPAERILDFDPVDLGLDAEAAAAEGARCFGASVCRACDACILMCPDLCITRDPASGRIVVDLDYCKGCGLCAKYCPKGAIRMEPEA